MKGNRVLAGILLWLTAVAGVAGLAWFAIDSAGKSITALPVSQPAAAPAAQVTATPTADPAAPAPATSGPATSTAPSGVSTGTSTSRPAAGSSSSARTDRPSQASHSPPGSIPRTRRDAVSGPWGSVSMSCTGANPTLVSAAPANDWKMQVDSSGQNGADSLELNFSGERGASAHVVGRCIGGRPDLQVDVQGGGGD